MSDRVIGRVGDRAADVAGFQRVRSRTEKLCDPLEVEDFGIQSMPKVSPPKWHLAHTTWFLEEFLLARHARGYEVFHPEFRFLFNSYYESAGPHLEQQRRGLFSRPTVREIFRYRSFVNETLVSSLQRGEIRASAEELDLLLKLAMHHEEQHQELLLADIKHIFWTNSMKPMYRKSASNENSGEPAPSDRRAEWIGIDAGLYEIGVNEDEEDEKDEAGGGETAFSFDNERPRHPVYIADFEIASALVSNGEYLEFMRAGGYRDPRYWLSAGWEAARQGEWEAPLYWMPAGGEHGGHHGGHHGEHNDQYYEMTLSGARPLDLREPVVHVSYYEADAFARWRGGRLPTEAEWEVFACSVPIQGGFLESERFHPRRETSHHQLWGEAWQWTSSAYSPYPGFRPLPGVFAEYNGKFMSNQMVLRGGSCATPRSHIRATYRNFFAPETRWQFSGIRLAR